MIVYRITNKVNGKLYFGITKRKLQKRWNEHKHNSKCKKSHLYLAMRKYGIENFIIEIVKVCDSDIEMYGLEKELIKKHNSNNKEFGYNNSIGGEVSSKGKSLSDETKKKISEYQKNRKRKPHSEKTKIKIRESAKGRDMSKAIRKSSKKRKGKQSHNIRAITLNGVKNYSSITKASIDCGISITSISNNLKGLSKTTKLGVWEYQVKN